MLDYIFFDTVISQKFKDHLTKMGIEFRVENDENFGSVQGEIVSIHDNISDDILNDLQVLYDNLQDELEQMLEQGEDGLLINAAGMQTQLKDGTMCTLRVEPTIVTRILTVLELDELQAFVDHIARSVEDCDSGHFCHHINKN